MTVILKTPREVELLVTELLESYDGLFWVDGLTVCFKEPLDTEVLTEILARSI